MALKKIIDVEIQDESFKRFMADFNAFQEKIGELPDDWKKVDDAMAGAGKSFAKASGDTNVLIAAIAASSAGIVEAIHEASKHQLRLKNATDHTRTSMMRLKDAVGGVANHIATIGGWMVKIGSITGVVGGVAGMLGLDALAGAAMSRSRSALGSGMTPGQQSALTTYFNPFGNAAAVGSNIASARNDVTKRWAFSGLGIGSAELNGSSNFNLSIDAIKRAQSMVKGMPEGTWSNIAQARGLTQFFSMDELRVLRNSPTSQINAAAAGAMGNAGSLGFSPEVARQWTDFSVALHRAGVEIESSLITGLHRLSGPLTKISMEVSDWISAFVQGPNMEKIINAVASGLKTFGDYVGSDKFTNDMRDFSAAISQLAKETVAALRYFGLIPGGNANADGMVWPLAQVSAAQAAGRAGGKPTSLNGLLLDNFNSSIDNATVWKGKGAYSPANIHADLVAASKKHGIPLDLLERQAMVESGYGKNLLSPAGAQGLMQIMPDTAVGLGLKDPMDPAQNAMAGALYDRQLLDYYKGNTAKAIAAYNYGMKNVDKAVSSYGDQWASHLAHETQGYVSQILGAGKSKTDARVAKVLSGSASADVAELLGKLHSALSKPVLTPKITVQNNSSANVAVQMNGAAR